MATIEDTPLRRVVGIRIRPAEVPAAPGGGLLDAPDLLHPALGQQDGAGGVFDARDRRGGRTGAAVAEEWRRAVPCGLELRAVAGGIGPVGGVGLVGGDEVER